MRDHAVLKLGMVDAAGRGNVVPLKETDKAAAGKVHPVPLKLLERPAQPREDAPLVLARCYERGRAIETKQGSNGISCGPRSYAPIEREKEQQPDDSPTRTVTCGGASAQPTRRKERAGQKNRARSFAA